MPIRGVIFDFDGTLADTIPVCLAAFRSAFALVTGREFSDAEIVATFGPTEEGALRRLSPDRWQEGLDHYLAEYERLHDRCPGPFPEIVPLLESLAARDVRLGLVTGKGPVSARNSLERFGLARYFDPIEAGSPDGPAKPVGIRRALREWSLPPETVAYVGDTAYDMVASAEVGVIGLGAAWSATATVEEAPPGLATAVVPDVAALSAWPEPRLPTN
jgi:phosphoglycolate phosphatase-like HAD superfamily hydrolase